MFGGGFFHGKDSVGAQISRQRDFLGPPICGNVCHNGGAHCGVMDCAIGNSDIVLGGRNVDGCQSMVIFCRSLRTRNPCVAFGATGDSGTGSTALERSENHVVQERVPRVAV